MGVAQNVRPKLSIFINAISILPFIHRHFFSPIFRGALKECTAESRSFVALLQLIVLNCPKIDLKRCPTFVETVHCFYTSEIFEVETLMPSSSLFEYLLVSFSNKTSRNREGD